MSKPIILIGGAPTSGKSTVAVALSERLGLPWISTDQIRTVMRAATMPDLSPDLFNPVNDPEIFLTRYSAKEIARMEMTQGEAVWPGIKALIDGDYTWREGFIIEWVNILPSLVARDYGEDDRVRAVFLLDEDEDRIRHVVHTRGLWDDAGKYGDHLKEKEVEWVQAFNADLKADAEHCGYPVVSISKSDADADQVLAALDYR